MAIPLNHTSHPHEETIKETRITTLYPLIGVCTAVVSYGYLHFGLMQRRENKDNAGRQAYEDVESTTKVRCAP